jgi:hypothetical protein
MDVMNYDILDMAFHVTVGEGKLITSESSSARSRIGS